MSMEKFKKYVEGRHQGHLARELDIAQSTLSQIKNGKRGVNLDLAFRIEKVTRGKVKARDFVKNT